MLWLFNHAKWTEWETAHAAENQFCPYCIGDKDSYTDHKYHEPNCEYVKMMADAKKLLELWGYDERNDPSNGAGAFAECVEPKRQADDPTG